MAYTEILLPQTYVNDPGGFDFIINGNGPASANPAQAVAALLNNDSQIFPVADQLSAYHAWPGNGAGRFILTNHTINGVVQSVEVRMLYCPRPDGGGDHYLRTWTHGVLYQVSTGNYKGQSGYPPGVGWRIFGVTYNNNPFTGAQWTLAELDDLNAGFLLDWPFGGPWCDQVYVIVTYSKITPTVATQAASGVTVTQATLNGSLTDDGGEPCTLFFEWGPSPGLGNTIAAGTGSTGASFSALISGLLAGTNYYFRACATNSRGTAYGAILSLTSTAPPPGGIPTVLTLSAVEVTENGGKLQGLVQDSIGRYGDVRFEWGGTTVYGNTTPWQSGFKTGDMFNAQLLNLAEGAVYHFRAQFRGSGIVSGSDAAFTTLSNLGAVTLVDEETLQRLEIL